VENLSALAPSSQEMKDAVNSIYKLFIEQSAPQMINLPGKCQQEVEARIAEARCLCQLF